MSITKDMLKKNDLFAQLTDDILEKFVASAEEVPFPEGEALVVQYEKSDQVYLVTEGKVRGQSMVDDNMKHLDFKQHDLICLNTIVEDQTQSDFLATALSDVRCFVWNSSDWKKICQEDHTTGYKVGFYIARTFQERIKRYLVQLLDTVSWGIE